MNAVLSAASAEELAALRAQIESLQSLLRDRESEADRKTRQIRELETTLKSERRRSCRICCAGCMVRRASS